MNARGLLLPSLVALAALAVLVALGTWQIERLAWKNAVVAQVAARTAEAPAPVPPVSQWPALNNAEDEYRPVTATGRFDHARETLIYTVLSDPKGPLKGPGFWVVTPLLRNDGPPVLVNRGFVPEDRRSPGTRAEGQVAGEVRVTGLMRLAEEPSWFVPENDPGRNAWYRRDPEQIGRARGLTDVAPFLIDADAAPNPGGLPQGGETRLSFPNRHLEYALTWYGLAVTLVGVYLAFVVTRLRTRPQPLARGNDTEDD
ncbi:SURF1 family protein [Aquabacter spiritensis]|uniref:SURF1-like protein n=1 Tax=Aquabacter spiritensis TaxID=933073 RepID=A0A4R3LU15_9HYPH|nr:SURF1 family protein [Aquabacter spiritensis]TCT03456.1 surfeit locus 1 family protein [Aquabacter spiritensis]